MGLRCALAAPLAPQTAGWFWPSSDEPAPPPRQPTFQAGHDCKYELKSNFSGSLLKVLTSFGSLR